MVDVILSATRMGKRGKRYRSSLTFDGGAVSMSSAETYATIEDAITAAAWKLLRMPERLARLDQEATHPSA